MTTRHYYHDATTTRFTASIVDHVIHDGRPAVVLDETYFYPSSGGQPYDVGRLQDSGGSVAVIDVITIAPDAPVIHVLAKPWTGANKVTGEIDWRRRFDHMQQHTGQHILSQAFIRVAKAETVGFHLSDQTVTIDLDTADLNSDHMVAAEQLANDVIWQNLPITVRMVSLEEAQRLSLRKLPTKRADQLRLIAIGDFDVTACGGTHVAASGQVGLIKLVRTERRGDLTRVEFCCGGRALDDYRRKHVIAVELAGTLTTGYDDITASVGRLQEESRQWRSLATARQKALVEFEADRMIREAETFSGQRLVVAVREEGDADSLRLLVNRLVANDHTIALLAFCGERTHFVFGRSSDAPGHMGDLMRAALSALEGAKGGGSPSLAQGSGPPTDRPTVAGVLAQARLELPATSKPVE